MSHDISERKSAERQRQRVIELNEVSRTVATSALGRRRPDARLQRHPGRGRPHPRRVAFVPLPLPRRPPLGVPDAPVERRRRARRRVGRASRTGARCTSSTRSRSRRRSTPGRPDVLVRGGVIRIPDVSRSGLVPREGSGVLRPDVQALLVLPVIIQGQLQSFFGFVDTRAPREWEDDEFAILQIIVDSFAGAVERRIVERERALIADDLEKAVAREKDANRYKSEFLANMSHELRTPDERDRRLRRAPRASERGRGEARDVDHEHPEEHWVPAQPHQRRPGPVEDRGRADGDRSRALVPDGARLRRRGASSRTGRGEAPRVLGHLRGARARRGRDRSRPLQAGAREPGGQRDQVHGQGPRGRRREHGGRGRGRSARPADRRHPTPGRGSPGRTSSGSSDRSRRCTRPRRPTSAARGSASTSRGTSRG